MFKPKPSKPVLYEFVFRLLIARKDLFNATLRRIHLLRASYVFVSRRFSLLAGIFVLALTVWIPLQQATTVNAATPTLNFQARLESSTGGIAPDGDYNVEFKLYQGGTELAGGTDKWTETRTGADKVRVANGYLTVNLGSVTNFPSTINWDDDLFLTMNIGGTGTPTWDGEMNPRLKLTSVPYAFQAASATQLETIQGSYTGNLQFATLTDSRNYILPDTTLATVGSPATICVFNGTVSNCPAATGSAYYIQNTGGSATPQTEANFNIQGTDSATDGTVVGILRGAAAGQTEDLLQLQATNGTVLTAFTATGNLEVASSVDTYTSTTLNIGATNASDITVGQSGVLTTVAGTLTVDEAATFGDTLGVTGLTTLSGGLTITSGGNVAIQRNTTDYTATGQQDNVNFGTGALFRITSASDVTFTGIAGGADGRIITLFNASANTVTIANNDTVNSDADKVVITGTGSDIAISAGSSIQLIYDSASSLWRIVSSVNDPSGSIQNQNVAAQTSANFWIDGSGHADTLQADTTVQTPDLDTATATALGIGVTNATDINIGHNAGTLFIDATNFDLSTAGAVTLAGGQAIDLSSNGATTLTIDTGGAAALNLGTANANAVSISTSGVTTTVNGALTVTEVFTANSTAQFNDNVTVAAGKTLRIVGGNTASHAAAPTTAGQLYFDTDTNQLLTSIYNTDTASYQWKAAGQQAVLVAASNSSVTDKQAADYVADGTADQVEINYALTKAAGGKVYLFPGTYTVSDTVSVPNDTTLAGASRGAIIQFDNLAGASKSMITNTTTGGSGTGIVIRDLTLDGDKATNNTGTVRGVYLNGIGNSSTNLEGAKITGLLVRNFIADGVYSSSSALSTITGNTIQSNSGYGIYTNGENRSLITDNIITDSGLVGAFLTASSRITFSSNIVSGSISHGLRIDAGANNIIIGNTLRDNTASGSASSIYLVGADNNLITGNYMTDSAGSGYAINVSDAASDNNYLANNYYSGTGASSINNAGTNTVYGGQLNGSGNYVIQPASTKTVELLANTNITGNLAVTGTGSFTGGSLSVTTTTATDDTLALSVTTGGAAAFTGTITNTDLTAARTWTLPDEDGIICTNAVTGVCSTAGTGYVQFAPTAAQVDASNNNSIFINKTSGTGSILKLQKAGTDVLDIANNGDATFSQNVTVAAGKTLTLAGGNTAGRPVSPTEGTLYYDTTTKQLLIYANGKWQADRSESIIVAASNSSDAAKASADYVTDGETSSGSGTGAIDGDQIEINNALTAAAVVGAKGKVYLLAGTYTIDAPISIPNNVTLAGSGASTVVQLGNFGGTSTDINMIESLDQTTATGVVVQNLKLDGRSDRNTSGIQQGVLFRAVGSGTGSNYATDRSGGTISGLWVERLKTTGIYMDGSANNNITGNIIRGNGIGLFFNYSSNNTAGNNTIVGNTSYGVYLSNSSRDTVTGNTIDGNSGNGIFLANNSHNNTIASNTLYSNAGSGATDNILVTDSDSNSITGNRITDTSGSGYAINISNSAADNNYLADNYFSGTGATSINDAGTGTIHGGQLRSSGSYVIQPASNIELKTGSGAGNGVAVQSSSATAFRVQNSGAAFTLFTADATATKRVTIGTTTTPNGLTSSNGDLMVVGNAEVQGTLYFGNSGSNAIYTESAGGPLRFKGTARNDVSVTLTPEFAGATLNGTGIGTMTADFCSNGVGTIGTIGGTICNSGQTHNYYEWFNGTQASAQAYDVYARWQVPSSADATSLTMSAYGSRSTASDSVQILVFDASGTACAGSATNVSTTDNAWTTNSVSLASCTPTAGTNLTIRIRMTASQNNYARAGEITINYKSLF